MNAQDIQELARSINIQPCLWNDCKKITAKVVEIRFIQSVRGPAIILYLNLHWDGHFGGKLERQSAPIIIEEGTSPEFLTYHLNVEGANLRNPEIALWPCKNGIACYEDIPVRAIQEDTEVEGIEVWHEKDGQITINPECCPSSTRVEREQKTEGTTTIDICLRDQYGTTQRYQLSPEAARNLGKALCFAAQQ